jgi:hemerythrin-like domain-containing protein
MPAPSDDPFDQLLRSHRRLEERLDDLRRAAFDLGGPHDAEAQAFVDQTVEWMERSVRRHEQDEERSLFPRLTRIADLEPLVARLAEEHRAQERMHAQLAEARGDRSRTMELARLLGESYARHIRAEEDELFPAAKKLLDAAARAAMEAEMQSRRGR